MTNKQQLRMESLVFKKESGKGNITLDFGKLRRAALTLRALNHPLRKKIMRLLEDNGAMMVTDIYTTLKIEQSVASRHLGILRNAEVVIAIRDDVRIFYNVNTKRIAEVISLVEDLAQNVKSQ